MTVGSGNTIDSHDFADWFNSRIQSFASSSSETVYHTGNPTPPNSYPGPALPYGGSATEGLAPGDSLPASAINVPNDEVGDLVDGSSIRDAVLTYARTLNQVRRVRVLVNVTGGGGNTGTYPNPGIIYDQTFLANVPSNFRSNWATGHGIFDRGNIIDADNPEDLFQALAAQWQAYRDNGVGSRTFTFDICHSSCHSSCHGSRGRR